MPDLRHAHGAERLLLQVRQLRKHKRLLLRAGPEGDHRAAMPEEGCQAVRLGPSPSHRVPCGASIAPQNGVQELRRSFPCLFNPWPREIEFTCQLPIRCRNTAWRIRHFSRQVVRCPCLEGRFKGFFQFCAVELF